MLVMDSTDSLRCRSITGLVASGGGPRKDGFAMSEFADQLDTRIDDVRHRIHEARSAGNDFLVENLIDDLQNLMELAGRNDVDTGPIAEVIQAETGALPVIPSPEEA
jgi:hypothetical protein